MLEAHSAKQTTNYAGSDDIRRVFRHIDDHTVAAVLAFRPTVPQLEEAAARAAGAGDVFAAIRPAKGVVEGIVGLVAPGEDEFEERT
jgi:hypothetical protein